MSGNMMDGREVFIDSAKERDNAGGGGARSPGVCVPVPLPSVLGPGFAYLSIFARHASQQAGSPLALYSWVYPNSLPRGIHHTRPVPSAGKVLAARLRALLR